MGKIQALVSAFPYNDSQLIQHLILAISLLQLLSQAVTGAPLSSQGMSCSVSQSRILGTSAARRAISTQRVHL